MANHLLKAQQLFLKAYQCSVPGRYESYSVAIEKWHKAKDDFASWMYRLALQGKLYVKKDEEFVPVNPDMEGK